MSTADQTKVVETAVIEDTGLAAFYRDMNTSERRTFWACAAGSALDGMDFMIYPLVIGTIIAMWNVDAGFRSVLLSEVIAKRGKHPMEACRSPLFDVDLPLRRRWKIRQFSPAGLILIYTK